MFIVILALSIFLGIIYGVFKIFFWLSNSLFLIDENFVNYIKSYNDPTIQKFIDSNEDIVNNELDVEEEDKTPEDLIKRNKKINRHLRLDFFISLFFGFIWFLFPIMVIDIKKLNTNKTVYIGKTLGLFTLISALWPLHNIRNGDYKSKRKILIGKFICACLTMFSFLLIVFFRKTMSFGNVLSVILTSIWCANGYYSLI